MTKELNLCPRCGNVILSEENMMPFYEKIKDSTKISFMCKSCYDDLL